MRFPSGYQSYLLPLCAAVMVAPFFREKKAMQRTTYTDQIHLTSTNELHKHIAFHEAGHVAAIYIRNQQQQLPPIFFQIIINKEPYRQSTFFAKIEGGRLIDNLPVAEIEHKHFVSDTEKQNLQKAYEADVINLLAGPLAEAKFVALRDDEIFNPHLINIYALKNYGGHSDLEQASRYLEYFISDPKKRALKIQSLFTQAFNFINQYENWQCIQHFADYLLENKQSPISCEEASAVFDQLL